MEKKTKFLAFVAIPLSCIVLICLFLILTGHATLGIPCFAVDSDDRIYVGTQNDILVFDDGVLVNTINPRTSRAYMFTINEDGNILLSTASKEYLMDLEGNIIHEQDDPGAHTYNQIQYNKQKFTSINGDTYELAAVLGRTSIVKNNTEKVYQISLLSFVVKLCLIICVAILFISPLWLLLDKRTGLLSSPKQTK